MARPLRIEYPGACYHVVNHGNQRNRIFFSPMHYELFLEKLCGFSEQFGVSTRCYCIMPNHFHLYLQTHEGNLSRFMQSLLTSFCYSLNRLRGKSGHIFQGRFKCHLVEDAAYSLGVSRYIHLNPVRMEMAKEVSFSGKRRMLESFKWSSYAAYAGKTEAPEWLDVKSVIGKFESGNEFAERVRRKYLMNLNVTDPKGQRDLARLKGNFTFEEILSSTARYFKTDADELLRKSSRCEARKALMYLANKYCRGQMPLTEIGRRMSIGQSGFVRSRNRFDEELGKNRELALRLREIEDGLISIAGV